MPGKGVLGGLVAVALAVCVLAVAPAASAFIYWAASEGQRIGRANNDGSGIDNAFITTGALPVGVAVDSAHIYWANENSNTIGRANLDGSGVDNSFITGVVEPDGIAVNANSIYWSALGGTIGKADLSGANKKTIVTGLAVPCGVALDAGHVYWGEVATGTPAYVARAGLDGSFQQLTYVTIPETSFPCGGVAVNSANIFWADSGFFGGGTKIGRAAISGGGPDPNFISGASTPCGLALDGSRLYWANAGTGAIARANSDGTAVEQGFLQTNAGVICGIAIDSLASSPVPAGDTTPPQTTILAGPGKKLSTGLAKFRFRSDEAGSSFACKLDRRKAAECTSPKTYKRLRPGKHVFKAWAIDAAGNKDPTPAKRRFRVPS